MVPRAGYAPRKSATITTRILASFGITVFVFTVTVGWSVFAHTRIVESHEELAKGYVPAALRMGQLRATQVTLSTLIDGMPDERTPMSTRMLLELLVGVRRAKLIDTREALADGLRNVGSPETRRLSLSLTGQLDSVESLLHDDPKDFDQLFLALSAEDKEQFHLEAARLESREHEADRRLKALNNDLQEAMDSLDTNAKTSEQRALYALIFLATMTLSVGLGVALHLKRILSPLSDVTERAKAVAKGDLTPRLALVSDDEIGELSLTFERMVSELADAQNQALTNERLAAIGQMAAHVTHEIRNPLSSIGLNLDLLEEELVTTSVQNDAQGLLTAISREVQRLEHLSEEYLRVARLPSPNMEAERIESTLREIVAFARPELERAGCTVEFDFASSLPPAFYDEAQIRQAILNLIRNARESMPEGGPIAIRAYATGMSVLIEICDRGCGIPEGIQSRVFDPFFSTKGEGTGLGLAISRQIVASHGGELSCSSRPDGGTLFRLSLPLAPARTSDIGFFSQGEALSSIESGPKGHYRDRDALRRAPA
jgi:signal transduction histidine kinase